MTTRLALMGRSLQVIAAAAVLFALTSCAGAAPEPVETSTSDPAPSRTSVDWDAYPGQYQQLIDDDTAAGNCDALQDAFDAAPDDPKLLAYIDEALTEADCY